MIFGYKRVSSRDQACARQDIPDCDRMYEEKISGGKRARPELDKMLEQLRAGDVVRVYSIDRLARSLYDLEGLLSQMNAKGVTGEILKENLKFSTDDNDHFARLQMQLLGAFAQFERSIIRARSDEGRAKARAEGRSLGGRPCAGDPGRVQELLGKGIKPTEISRMLGISLPTVYRYKSLQAG